MRGLHLPSVRRGALVLLASLGGVAAGLGAYTFVYARGYSYFTDDPAACANCHVMSEQLAGWVKSSHRAVATCNDCHTPPHLAGKYLTKAVNGFWHSFYFTTGSYPEPIRIRGRNRRVTESACRGCHAAVVAAIEPGHGGEAGGGTAAGSCIRCHGEVGHPDLATGG